VLFFLTSNIRMMITTGGIIVRGNRIRPNKLYDKHSLNDCNDNAFMTPQNIINDCKQKKATSSLYLGILGHVHMEFFGK